MKQLLFILGVIFTVTALGFPSEIIMIRHGEKPEVGNNLSCKGLHRSLALVNVLSGRGINKIYAVKPKQNSDDGTTTRARMFQTATPFAVVNNLDIDSSYERDDTSKLADKIKSLPSTDKVLVVWEHHAIVELVKDFNVTNAPTDWGKTFFDDMWVIKYNGSTPTFTIEKENLTPSDDCKF